MKNTRRRQTTIVQYADQQMSCSKH